MRAMHDSPAGFDARGLPMGLPLIGRPQGEATLLAPAARYESTNAALLAQRPHGTAP
ncbi:MAG: hypothetical protein Fur0019_01060 [Tibeticola sp.]